MNNNTSKLTGKVVNCFVCDKEVYKAKSALNKVKDKKYTCSKECSRQKRTVLIVKNIEKNLNIDSFECFLQEKYIDERLPTTKIAELVYGKRHYHPNIINWLHKFDIEVRSQSESVAMQWEDNDKRRSEQSEFAKNKLGKGTEGRKKLIDIMQTKTYKKKQSISKTGRNNGMYGMRGELHPRWDKNSCNEQRKRERKFYENTQWRKSVMKRDNYTCDCCRDRTGGNLVAHHLNGYNWDIENRTNVDNGVTLCDSCHKEFHKVYGYGNNTKKQYEMFKSGETPNEYMEQLTLV